ncbi:MAG: leucine-rich repeat domain-containing protein [Clostridia bacterium]|nr:leucine-rich repeat domain-containing protein [Clostridia bacterium]
MKGKFFLSLVCAAAVCFTAAGLAGCAGNNDSDNTAEPPTEGLEYTLNDDGKSYSVTGIGSATDTKIVISAEYEGKPVTDIGKSAFAENQSITSVTVPDSVTVIKTSAFADCSSLKEVKLSYGLEELWQSVFYNCSALENVVLPDSLMSVGAGCFSDSDGSKLKNFRYTEQEGVLYVGTARNPYHALVGMATKGATTAFTVHKDTKVIATGAFENNRNTLQNIFFPQELTGINVPRSLFNNLLRTGKFNVNSANGYYLGTAPQSGNKGNPYVALIDAASAGFALKDGVKIIAGDGLRANTQNSFATQTEIVIPDGIDSIGEYAFLGFDKLEKITLPSSLTILSRHLFDKCSALTDITFKGTKAQWNAIKKSSNWDVNTADYTIHCTDGDIAKA